MLSPMSASHRLCPGPGARSSASKASIPARFSTPIVGHRPPVGAPSANRRAPSPESLWVHNRPGSQVLTARPLDSSMRSSSSRHRVDEDPKVGMTGAGWPLGALLVAAASDGAAPPAPAPVPAALAPAALAPAAPVPAAPVPAAPAPMAHAMTTARTSRQQLARHT